MAKLIRHGHLTLGQANCDVFATRGCNRSFLFSTEHLANVPVHIVLQLDMCNISNNSK